MKRLMILIAAMACHSAAAQVPPSDSLRAQIENHTFTEAFVRDARRTPNLEGHKGAEKTVYELYKDLFDEGLLIERGILKRPRPGRYVTPQTTIDYGILPADSTLGAVHELLETMPSQSATSPLPARLEKLLRTVAPFRLEEQQEFRRTVCHRIDPFYPETIYPADSVIYITSDLLKRMQEFSKKGISEGSAVSTPRNRLLMEQFSARNSAWTSHVHWIDRPIWISGVIFEPDLDRAFVNALVGANQGWGILLRHTPEGRWEIVSAQVLYYAQ